MGTLYIDRRRTRLELAHKALTIREPEAQPRSVPLSLIDRLIVIGQVELSSGVLTTLAESGVSLVFMPSRGQRRSAFLRSEGHGDAVRRLGQYRLIHLEAERQAWARRLVRLRLAGQQRLLASALYRRPDQRQPLTAAHREIEAAQATVRREAPAGEQLRGQEGTAAAAFFRGYGALFAEALGFSGRNRRPPRDPVNAVLSLGYTLAHGDALRAVTAAGLDPAIGVLHEPAWGRDSLACDLTEIARARVERLTWELFASETLQRTDFTNSTEGVRLGKAARQTFFGCWERHAGLHRRWQRRAAQALAAECAHHGAQTIPEA
ncbi:CRISPR-associated endonuclease Cas1 [Halorhodospira halophila]|uniref:CRISPR-associated endonuclease Cas1 n=1 Tax=Halorhodospira halophila (strain DSM 244 / SL1) TaxID=349124 RepID=A1WUP2_HALHL|nr:CRISPR-associated endonuclease Cas1 [Halorhodospira halophila]ABM61404.1 CRISPR-associated protein, Cas1 family [Halorhodospira halophila SL1]MBK1728646.1 CRISPR-associated endonuclease Cas1 [Halorhodospira halophila]